MTHEDANHIAINASKLEPVVLRFRALMEESRAIAKSMDSLAVMQDFHEGCCKPASMLLAYHLASTHRVPEDSFTYAPMAFSDLEGV